MALLANHMPAPAGSEAKHHVLPEVLRQPVRVLVTPPTVAAVAGRELEATLVVPVPSGLALVARPAGVVLAAGPEVVQLQWPLQCCQLRSALNTSRPATREH